MSPNFVGEVMSANPDDPGTRPLDFTFPVFLALVAICIVAAVWAAVRRTWRSTGVERLQMRLFAASIALLILVLMPAQYLATHGHSTGRYVLLSVAFALIPLSCGVAILRYRLYDIDRIIGRTTAYVLVTGVLLCVYVAVVTSLTSLVPESGSTGQTDSWAVAVATLVAAGLFRPVLRWARRVVDRRFNREQFDAERAVEAFAVRLRDEVESGQVRADLLAVLGATVQPASTGLWLREPAP
jgi:drug/metabolite transporter (DMT)-like permease